MMNWTFRPWGQIRTCLQPTSAIAYLDNNEQDVWLTEWLKLQQSLTSHQEQLRVLSFSLVQGCEETQLRRKLIDLQRRLFRQQQIGSRYDDLFGKLSQDFDTRLDLLHNVELTINQYREEWHSVYDRILDDKLNALSQSLGSTGFADALALVSPRLSSQTQHWHDFPKQLAEDWKRKKSRRGILTVARYLCRSACRPDPFGRFAAANLVTFSDTQTTPADCDRVFIERFQVLEWLWQAFLSNQNNHVKLKINPTLQLTHDREQSLWQYHLVGSLSIHPGVGLMTLGDHPMIQRIKTCVQERSHTYQSLSQALTIDSDQQTHTINSWIDELLKAGVIEPIWPEFSTDIQGIVELNQHITNKGLTVPEFEPTIQYLQSTLKNNKVNSHGSSQKPPVHVKLDSHMKSGLYQTLPFDSTKAKKILEPALMIGHSSRNRYSRLMMTHVFTKSFGHTGVCHNVLDFFSEVIKNDGLMRQIQFAQMAPGWRNTQWADGVVSSARDKAPDDENSTCYIPLSSFYEDMPNTLSEPAKLALYVQFLRHDDQTHSSHTNTPSDKKASPPILALNRILSGGDKYLTRFLAAQPMALNQVTSMRPKNELLVSPELGLNFEHLAWTSTKTLAWPSTHSDTNSVIHWDELRLKLNQDGLLTLYHVDGAHKDKTGNDILEALEPVHLGFLRDSQLPDLAKLVAVLGESYADDAVTERANIYEYLDRESWLTTHTLPFWRPAVQIGQLLLERSRFAIPTNEIPVRGNKTWPDYLLEVTQWRAQRNIPTQGMVKVFGSMTSPWLLDFTDPISLSQLLKDIENTDKPVVLTALDPSMEKLSIINTKTKQNHVTEYMIQFDGHSEAV
ncbi:lantibiotic dehydratase [Vibrio sp. S4M6]|uniref:lantibiotic dehydratase n=1 Tax=Vibrio sinus TaxID=2946865 RepID=UPI00202A5903|nr:lantibiotic dehydratase [Vibrio sinus]MCL9780771.1 lantibiotic dehydratase [Vibrio sinus]